MDAADLLKAISEIAWGPVTIVLLVGTGIYLTVRLRFVQFRYLWHSVRCISGKYDNPDEQGDISHFRALTAALSATIGTGNIAGVATAIALGGPGAVFWMWVTAVVGMATKFTSCALALHFRDIHEDGSASGGPMYFLEKGFAPRWLAALGGEERTRRWAVTLAVAFALFGMIASFGIGNMVQANSVVNGLDYVFAEKFTQPAFGVKRTKDGLVMDWSATRKQVGDENEVVAQANKKIARDESTKPLPWVYSTSYLSVAVGLILAALVGLVILGGIRRIAAVAARIVPFMCVVYIVGAIVILALHVAKLPDAFALIFSRAFRPDAAGGGVVGFTIAQAIRYGVARGVFSNESGLGSAPMAHAAAKTKELAREGFVAMLGPLIDTIIICSMTALVIIVTGVETPKDQSSEITARAFDAGLFGSGHYIVGFGLIFFAYSTMISWSYYGDRCAEYLLGRRAIAPYRCLFVALVIVGAVGGLQTIWTIADILNALMALPNLIGLIALAGFMAAKMRDYTTRLKAGQFD